MEFMVQSQGPRAGPLFLSKAQVRISLYHLQELGPRQHPISIHVQASSANDVNDEGRKCRVGLNGFEKNTGSWVIAKMREKCDICDKVP